MPNCAARAAAEIAVVAPAIVVAAKMLRRESSRIAISICQWAAQIYARRDLQARYDCLFIDEFQDTDPLQAEILLSLSGHSKADAATKAGKLFVVGDPKQSIYRFRRADIDIYNIVRQRFSETGVGREIARGVVDGERVAITKGLAVGELVVTEGGDRLRDGRDRQL